MVPGDWRGQPSSSGGGVLIDGGIHKVDILAYLSGMPRQVFASSLPAGQPPGGRGRRGDHDEVSGGSCGGNHPCLDRRQESGAAVDIRVRAAGPPVL